MELRKYLNLKNISVKDFANKLKVSRFCVTNYLIGRRKPSLIIAKKIQDATNNNVTIDDLIAYWERMQCTKKD